MSSRRTIILIVALVMSAVSVFGIFSYVKGVEETATAEQVTGTYWVVKDEIPKGTDIDRVIQEGMLVEVDVPLELLPDTAIAEPASELKGNVAVTTLPRNTPIVAGLFLPSDVIATGVTERLAEKGLVTVTLALDQVRTAAYQIRPGDFVNILSVRPAEYVEDPSQSDLPPDQRTDIAYETNRDGIDPFISDARYVYQMVEVLAIDKALTPQLGENAEEGATAPAGNQGLVTLAVPPEAVQLILSMGTDSLYLSLVPQNYEPRPLGPVNIDLDQFPAEVAEQLTPYFEQPVDQEAGDPATDQ